MRDYTNGMATSIMRFVESEAARKKYQLMLKVGEQYEKTEEELQKKRHRGGHHSNPKVRAKITRQAKRAYNRIKAGDSNIAEEAAKLGISAVALVNRFKSRGWVQPQTGKPYAK